MEHLTPTRLELFQAANRDLESFLQRVDQLVHGAGEIDADQWQAVRRLVASLAPDVPEASLQAAADPLLDAQLRAYAANLRALEASLNQVRCVMLARRAHTDAAQRHVDGLRSWVNAYRQTAP